MKYMFLRVIMCLWLFRLILLLSSESSVVAQTKKVDFPEEYLLSYTLGDDWQVYDEKYKEYVPYIPLRHGNSKSMGLWIEPSSFAHQDVVLYSLPDTYLFINQRLAAYYPVEGWASYSLDSLGQIYGTKPFFCTLYDDTQRLPIPQIFIGFRQVKTQKAENKIKIAPDFPIIERISQNYKYVLIFSFLMGLAGYTLLLNYSPKSFWSYFSFRSSLSSLAQKDNNLINKPVNNFNLIFVFVLSIWLSIYFETFFGLTDRVSLYSGQSIWFRNPWMLQVLLILGLNSLFFLKYAGLTFFGLLLNIPKTTIRIHFFEYLRTLCLYYTFAGLGIITLVGGFEYLLGHSFIQVMLYLTLIFHIIQSFGIVYLIIKQLTFKSLYLFYYLCIAELVPILIGAKLLVFNIYD